MKIAVISDIHGNAYALEAVLNVAKKSKIEKLFVLGDIVGYYYHPDIVLNLLSNWDYEIIKGNHENILVDLIDNGIDHETIRLKYGSGHKQALEKLNAKQLELLTKASENKEIVIDGISFLLCHGSPWDNNYYIYPDAENAILNKCDSVGHDYVFIGHTHYPFAHKNEQSILINPGSVGQSRQIGGIASWVIINTDNNCFEFKYTPYDTEILKREILINDPDVNYLFDILGRK